MFPQNFHPRKLGEMMVFYAGIGKFLYQGNQNEKN